MGNIITLYEGSIGINNKVPPHRLLYNQESGVSALAGAENVLVNSTGELVARRSNNKLFIGEYHSLFSNSLWGLVAENRESDTAIHRITVSDLGDVHLDGIWSGLPVNSRIDFCQVNSAVFFTSSAGSFNGMITKDCVVVQWKESIWPDNNSNAVWDAPPPADHLCYNAGRIYFSIDNVLHYTEFGHLGIYDTSIDGEQFPSKILMLISTVDGIYVSTEDAIYFLSGLDPHDWHSKKVVDYPALEWGKANDTIDPSFMGYKTNIPSTIVATKNGPVLCLPSGQVENLIDKNIVLSKCNSNGAIAVFDETLIIQTSD